MTSENVFLLPLLVAIAGLVLYAVTDASKHPKVCEAARLVFFAAFLVFMFIVGPEVVRITTGHR